MRTRDRAAWRGRARFPSHQPGRDTQPACYPRSVAVTLPRDPTQIRGPREYGLRLSDEEGGTVPGQAPQRPRGVGWCSTQLMEARVSSSVGPRVCYRGNEWADPECAAAQGGGESNPFSLGPQSCVALGPGAGRGSERPGAGCTGPPHLETARWARNRSWCLDSGVGDSSCMSSAVGKRQSTLTKVTTRSPRLRRWKGGKPITKAQVNTQQGREEQWLQ